MDCRLLKAFNEVGAGDGLSQKTDGFQSKLWVWLQEILRGQVLFLSEELEGGVAIRGGVAALEQVLERKLGSTVALGVGPDVFAGQSPNPAECPQVTSGESGQVGLGWAEMKPAFVKAPGFESKTPGRPGYSLQLSCGFRGGEANVNRSFHSGGLIRGSVCLFITLDAYMGWKPHQDKVSASSDDLVAQEQDFLLEI